MRLSVRACLDREAARNSDHDCAGREFESAVRQAPNVIREKAVIPAAASLRIPKNPPQSPALLRQRPPRRTEDCDDTRRQVLGHAAVCRTAHRANRGAERARQRRDESRLLATCRDKSRHTRESIRTYAACCHARRHPTSDIPDQQRQPTTGERDTSRYVERLEREVEQAKDERDFLREQIDRKDKTIDLLLERDRETNFLIRGLQDLIPRLGMSHRDPPASPPTL